MLRTRHRKTEPLSRPNYRPDSEFPPVSLLKPMLLTETFYPSCFFAS